MLLCRWPRSFNTIVITDGRTSITKYRLEYFQNGVWKTLLTGDDKSTVKIHRFNRVWGEKVRILIDNFSDAPAIAEFGVYDERR